MILKFIWPNPNSIFNCHDPKALKNLLRIRLGLIHLREHKFKHSFQDTCYLCLWIRYWNTLPLPHLLPFLWCGTKYSPEQYKTNPPYYLKFESLSNYSRSSLWRFFSKNWNKYWNFEQHYELYSLNKEIWRFYFMKDNMVLFETPQFSFVYFIQTKILFRIFCCS